MAKDTKAMDHAGGKSVNGRDARKDNTGEQTTNLNKVGKAWPRKHTNELRDDQSLEGNHPGEIGTKLGLESIPTPNDIASLMEDDGSQLQLVFDKYANTADCISLNEFAEYAAAYGFPVRNEVMLETLLHSNRDFMFQEHKDASGRYWTKAIAENKDEENKDKEKAAFCKKCYKTHKPGDCKKCEESHNRRGQALSEAGGRDFEEIAPTNLDYEDGAEFDRQLPPDEFGSGMPGEGFGAEHISDGIDGINGRDGNDSASGSDEFGGEFGAEESEFDGEGGPYESGCPECPGMLDETGSCPDCGYTEEGAGPAMASAFGQEQGGLPGGDNNFGGERPGKIPPFDGTPGNQHRGRIDSHQSESQDDDQPMLLEDAFVVHKSDLPPVLNEDGTYKLSTHEGPPASHGGHEMDDYGGTSVSKPKLDKKSGLPQEPTDTKDMGKVWPRKHKNTGAAQEKFADSKHAEACDGFTTKISDLNLKTKQKNTGSAIEKFAGGNTSNTLEGGARKMHENIERLGKHVLKYLRQQVLESGKLQPGAKWKGQFLVSAGTYVNARQHDSLTEALVDTEELLQVFGPTTVTLEARYIDATGQLVMKEIVPLPKLNHRGPIVSESKVLFRYPELARDFAGVLVDAGNTCSAKTHNWGAAVSARIDYNTALKAFHAIREGTPPVI